MRYTLRLLTAAAVPARGGADLRVRGAPPRALAQPATRRWGDDAVPDRPVGRADGRRPTRTEDAAEAIAASATAAGGGARGGVAACSSRAARGAARSSSRGRDVEVDDARRGRTLIVLRRRAGACPFTRRNSPGEGLPVVVVDEEIYRLLPALVIATVDKFAQMPWKGATQALFGRVSARLRAPRLPARPRSSSTRGAATRKPRRAARGGRRSRARRCARRT